MIENVHELISRHGDRLAIICNHSGGKDSTRMLGFLKEHFPTVTMYVVIADTGFEHVRPVPAVEWARGIASSFGQKLYVVRNPNKTYLEMVERRGMFPAPKYRQCTSDLKRGPIETFIRRLPGKVFINCTGIRAEESSARAKQKPWAPNAGLMNQRLGRIVWNWMPIFEESLQDVLSWHWRAGVPLHPVYVPEYHCDGTAGGYLRRFSCRVCIFSTDADIQAIHANDREAFDLVSTLEERIGFTMRSGKSLVQIVSAPATDDVEEHPCLF